MSSAAIGEAGTVPARSGGSAIDSNSTHSNKQSVIPFLPPQPVSMPERLERAIKIGIVASSAILFAIAIASGKFHLRYSLMAGTHLDDLFWWSAFAYGGLMYGVLVWRIVLWRRYRPMESVSDAELPTVSVIIPAYNEGALVRQSILSVAGSRYPRNKFEIIAVDDGSADDTWLHMRAAADAVESKVRITAFKQPRNMGKRHALYAGFKQATGDVIITIDSDSVVHPDALRNGVTPLVREKTIGCVAGCVEVMNPRESMITRFLRTTFSLSFKFVRAYQSEYRGVFCTPGALSIYRAEIVHRVADEWLNQKFLGLPCTTGEDRAMTNLILREGWMTAYQGNAQVYAKMPADYIGLVKMLLRWGRSNIRETIFLFRFMFTNFRSRYLNTFRFNMLLTAITLLVPPIMILNSSMLLFTSYGYLMHQIGMIFIYGCTMGAIYYMNERDSDWAWLFVYEFFWVACLSWIIPYAAFTLRNTGWLTRAAKSSAAPAHEPAIPDRPLAPALIGSSSGRLDPAVAMAAP